LKELRNIERTATRTTLSRHRSASKHERPQTAQLSAAAAVRVFYTRMSAALSTQRSAAVSF